MDSPETDVLGMLFAVLRFAVPFAGNFTLDGSFSNLGNATTDVHILHNGASIFGSVINAPGGILTAPFLLPLNANAGDTIDFVVGWGGLAGISSSDSSDSTGLALTITGEPADAVPEPTTLSLLGLGLTALIVCRGKRKQS
jgi:hypothetical protein